MLRHVFKKIIFPLSHLHFSSVRQVISLSCHHACPSFSFLFFPSLTDIQLTLIVGVLFSKDLDSPYLTAHTHTLTQRMSVCGTAKQIWDIKMFFFLYRKLRQVQEIYISFICKFYKQTCACCLFSSNYVVSPELGFA